MKNIITKNIYEIKKENNEKSFINTGINKYDKIFKGFQEGEFVCLAGRPNAKTTSFCVKIAVNQAMKNKKVLFICDNDELKNISKTLEKSNKCNINLIRFYSGKKNIDTLFDYCSSKSFDYDLIIVNKDATFTSDLSMAHFQNFADEYEVSVLRKIAKMCKIPVVFTRYTNRLSGIAKVADRQDILGYSKIFRHLETVWLVSRKCPQGEFECRVFNDYRGCDITFSLSADEILLS